MGIEKKHCQQCGHEWWPRTEKRPAACPKCISRKWDQPKPVEKEA